MALDLVTAEKVKGIADAKANFSEQILAIAANDRALTYNEVVAWDGELDFALFYANLMTLNGNIFGLFKGLSKLINLKGLVFNLPPFDAPNWFLNYSNEVGYYDVSNLTALEKLVWFVDRTSLGTSFLIGDIGTIPALKHVEIRFLPDNLICDLSSKTNLEYLYIRDTGNYTPPILGNNINLTYVRCHMTAAYTTTVIGNMRNCLQLTDCLFKSSDDGGLGGTTAVADKILAELKIAKQNGGAIARIDITGMSAPTGGSSNSDYVYLTTNGVTVNKS